jgi:hypothetical protein
VRDNPGKYDLWVFILISVKQMKSDAAEIDFPSLIDARVQVDLGRGFERIAEIYWSELQDDEPGRELSWLKVSLTLSLDPDFRKRFLHSLKTKHLLANVYDRSSIIVKIASYHSPPSTL